MRRPRLLLTASLAGLGVLLPLEAMADEGPPSLPEGDAPAPEASDAEPRAGASFEADAEFDAGAGGEAAAPGMDADLDGELGGEGEAEDLLAAPGIDFPDDEVPGEAAAAASAELDDDPGMVQGRREGLLTTTRGGIGLLHTSLPDVGGKYTFRFRVGSDFFVRDPFMVDSDALGTDRHTRFRGNVNMGFTFTDYTEVWIGLNGSSNTNERADPNRQDRESIYALGDFDMGIKGAWRGIRGGALGVGGQLGTTLLAGTSGRSIQSANFFADLLVALDLRYLTKKQVPVRFATNLGYLLDNSWRLVDFDRITDLNSREVLRFGQGINYPRVRTRYAVDFPVRLGKERQFGIDPFLEYSWDISTFEAKEFRDLTRQLGPSPLPRSQSWLTVGLRGNVWSGLHLDLGVDVGTASPSFEYGPRVPDYQIHFGLGWSIDPKPVIKEVPVEVEPTAPPEPVVIDDGRIAGTVTGAAGEPVVGAIVRFPGVVANPLLTDERGAFVSYRFPAGPVVVTVELADGTVLEQTAELVQGEDTPLDFVLEGPPPQAGPVDGVMSGAFTDPEGKGVEVTVQITGMGIDEPFRAEPTGLIAVELPGGEYTAKITAPGFVPKTVEFQVDGDVRLEHSLERDTPVVTETPNVSGNKRAIRLRKKIRYEGDELAAASHDLLNEVAAFLAGHPEYAKVQVQVHTDDRGNPGARSQSRADSVVNYLVSRGVDASRLDARGLGAGSPVAVNLTADGRRKNNRTYLRVQEYND